MVAREEENVNKKKGRKTRDAKDVVPIFSRHAYTSHMGVVLTSNNTFPRNARATGNVTEDEGRGGGS